jgi:ATP-binding protein involved in chromosome partitioning
VSTIAVPVIDNQFSPHFGGADGFALFEVDEATKSVTSARVAAAPPHERGSFPRWLKEQGVSVILAGGMGPRAVQFFEQFGIAPVLGVDGGEPRQLVEAYLNGTLTATGEGCSGGHLHNCGDHDDGH